MSSPSRKPVPRTGHRVPGLQSPLVTPQQPAVASRMDSEAPTGATPSAAVFQQLEPSYDEANAISFNDCCQRFGNIWKLNDPLVRKSKSGRSLSALDKLAYLLPPERMAKFVMDEDSDVNDNKPAQSIFPLLRLLLPDKDTSRSFALKEATIAKLYSQALGIPEGSRRHDRLVHFTNQRVAGPQAGDFPAVLEQVLKEKISSLQRSTLTVGHVNRLLDDLSQINRMKTMPGRQRSKKITERRVKWVNRLLEKNLMPLEHRCIVSIIMGDTKLSGMGFKSILKWYHPDAEGLYNAHNSLKAVCNQLCQTPVTAQEFQPGSSSNGLSVPPYMAQSEHGLTFGTVFSPMASKRTGFKQLLHDLSHKWHGRHVDATVKAPLPILHPAFSIETKLDGERMLVHVSRDGLVKIHSRRTKWHSEYYSPVLGSAIRKALEKSCQGRMDVILDGEITAWDDGRQETVPFGSNRTIALKRKRHMEELGLIDPRDLELHSNDDGENKTVNAGNTFPGVQSTDNGLDGESCWLQYVVFDVVCVDGPGAAEFLDSSVSEHVQPRPEPGSIIHLDLFERKKLLYRLVEPQDKLVEFVNTVVVRPNARSVSGKEYFSPYSPTSQFGHPAYTLDSVSCALNGVIANRAEVDAECRGRRSDAQIGQARANAVDDVYRSIVEEQRLEGLMFKDLNSPYYLGEGSKTKGYWYKFKPDYYNGSSASDLDLVIIGAYYATGIGLSGRPSAFLVACVDSQDKNSFIPVCTLSAQSALGTEGLKQLLSATGFQYAEKEREIQGLGHWFEGDQRNRFLPDFVSKRAYNRGRREWQTDGWNVQKKDYPSLWIDPKHSRVVVTNAGELIMSDAFPSGVTLRFPRITRVRNDDGDDKDPSQCESELNLWAIYNEIMSERTTEATSAAVTLGSPSRSTIQRKGRFFTDEQFAADEKKRKAQASKRPRRVTIGWTPALVKAENNVLKGLVFTVLDGNYSVPLSGMDAESAREQGWASAAQIVKTKADIENFISRNGGEVTADAAKADFLIGGRVWDARVRTHVRAIENTVVSWKKTKRAERERARAKHRGVLKWAWVFSLVHGWLKESNENASKSIMEQNPELLHPLDFDYLVLAGEPEVSSWEIGDVSALQRAMEFATSASKRKMIMGESNGGNTEKRRKLPWQVRAITDLGPDKGWIMSAGSQRLWPYSSSDGATASSVDQPVVLYPDVFGSDYGANSKAEATEAMMNGADQRRWDALPFQAQMADIASSLPLARTMGAWVTPHLFHGVTHVVVGEDILKGEQSVSTDSDREQLDARCKSLMERLEAMDGHPVVLVSPQWVREKWETSERSSTKSHLL